MRALALLLLVACGTSPSGGSGGGSGTGGSSGGSGGSSGSGGGGGGGSSAFTGLVSLAQSCFGSMCSGSGNAYFFAMTSPGVSTSSCSTETIGACKVEECISDGGTPVPPTLRMESAGTLTVADAGVSFVWGGMSYPTFTGQRLWQQPGDTATLSATGATVPAFSRSVVAPHGLTLTSPSCPTRCPLPRGDFTLSWTGAESTTVWVALTSTFATRTVIVDCSFSSSPATVGAAAIAKLGATNAGYDNTLTVIPRSQDRFTAGSYDVLFLVTADGFSVPLDVPP